MITQKEYTRPEARQGFRCEGKVTCSTGVGTITIKGKDYSALITGIILVAVNNSATQPTCCQITSIAYSSTTGLTTILFRAFIGNQLATTTFSLTNSLVVHYSFWVDEIGLPIDESTNDSTLQAY